MSWGGVWDKIKDGADRAWDTGRGLVVGVPEMLGGVGTGAVGLIDRAGAAVAGEEYQPDTSKYAPSLSRGAGRAFGPDTGAGAAVGGLPEGVREAGNTVLGVIDDTGKGIAVAGGTDLKFFTQLFKTGDLGASTQVFSDDWQPFSAAHDQTAEQSYAQLMAPHLAGAPVETIQAELDRNPSLAIRANVAHVVLGTVWDPTLVGGKGIATARSTRLLTDATTGTKTVVAGKTTTKIVNKLTPASVHAANLTSPEAISTMLQSTRWHTTINPALSRVIAENPDAPAAALTREFFGDTTAGHRLGSLLAEPDEALRTHILLAANGNSASWEVVKQASMVKADELRNLTAETQRMALVDLPVARHDIKKLQRRVAVAEARLAKTDDPDVLVARIDQIGEELQEAEDRAQDLAQALDVNRAQQTALQRGVDATTFKVGDDATLAAQALPLFTSRQARIAAGNGVWSRLGAHAPSFLQSSPFSTPMVFHGLGSRLPGAELDPHDLDSAVTVRRWVDSLGTPKAESDALVQAYLDAPGVSGRKAVFAQIETEAVRSHFNRWADRTGKPRLTDAQMEDLLAPIRAGRAQITDPAAPTFGPQQMAEEGLGPVLQREARMSDGTMHVVPNYETQTTSVLNLASPLTIRSLSALTYRSRTMAPIQRAARVEDAWSSTWRPFVLARVNYILRNTLEEVFRTIPAARREGVDSKAMSQARRQAFGATGVAPASALSRLVTRQGQSATEKIARNAGDLATSPVKVRIGDDSALRSIIEVEFEGFAGPLGDQIEMAKVTAKGRNDPYGITSAQHAERGVGGKVELGAGQAPSGDFKPVMHPGRGDATVYTQAWAYTVNRHIKQSALGNKVLGALHDLDRAMIPSGQPGSMAALAQTAAQQNLLDAKIREVAYWLQNSPQGKEVSARLLINPGDHMAHARTVFAAVQATMPPAVRKAAQGGKVDEALLAQHLDVAPASINGEGMKILLAETEPQKVISNVMEKLVFGPSAHLQDKLARHPLATAVHNARLEQLTETVAKAKKDSHLSTEQWVAEDYATHAGIPFEVDSTLKPLGAYHGLYEHPAGLLPMVGPGDAKMAQIGLLPGAKTLNAADDAPAVLMVKAKMLALKVNPELAQFLPKITDSAQATGMSVQDLDDFVRALTADLPTEATRWRETLADTLRTDGVDALVNPNGSVSVLNMDAARLVKAPADFQPDVPRGIKVGENNRVTPEEVRLIQRQARHAGVAAVRRTFYDSSKVSVLSAFLRHISPFIGATEDAAKFWWRASMDSPQVTAGLVSAYNAPYRAGLVVDQYGQQVDAGDDTAGPKRIIMPRPLAEIWAKGANAAGLKVGEVNFSMDPKNLNFVLQGDLGLSPLATLPMAALAQRNPDLTEALTPLFPYGPPQSLLQALTPTVLSRMHRALLGGPSDPQLQMLANRYLAAEVVNYQRGLRPDPPTAEEALTAARHTTMLNLLDNLLGPTIGSTNVQSPFLPIMQAYRKAQEDYRRDPMSLGKEADGSPRDPQAWLIDTYGSDYAALTVSASKNLAGIDATTEGMARAGKFKDLIAKNPDFAALFIGKTEGRSQGVYNTQVATGMREQLGPEEYLAKIRVEEGWRKYQKFNTLLDLKMRQLGLTNLRGKKGEVLAEKKRQFVDAMQEENYDWWKQYKTPFTGRWDAFHSAAIDAVTHPELQKRPDMVALRDYLYQRALLTSIMAKRGRNYMSLDATGNGDLRDAWDGVLNRLKDSYPEFGDLHARWLENDPLKVGT